MRDVLRRYIVLPGDHEQVAVALFVLHTWVFAAAHTTPYFVVQSPEKQSGKTRLLEVISVLVRNPLQVASASEAALFRTIEAERCTLLLDEVDAIFAQNTERTEALRGLLNSGNRESGRAVRCVGKAQEPRTFSTFCPKVLAGIDEGRLPDTIADRAIEVRMKRKLPVERVERFRERAAKQEAEPLIGHMRSWAKRAEKRLTAANPRCPTISPTARPRRGSRCSPSRTWPTAIGRSSPTTPQRRSADKPRTSAASDSGCSSRSAASGPRSRTACRPPALCSRLNEEPELPYGGWSDGSGVNATALARYLRPYGIHSTTIRTGTTTPRGYLREAFREPWERYVPPDVADVADVAANSRSTGGVA